MLRQKFSGFRIPQAKMSRIPEYGFSYMGRILVGRFSPRDSRVILFLVAVQIDLAVEISLVNPSYVKHVFHRPARMLQHIRDISVARSTEFEKHLRRLTRKK